MTDQQARMITGAILFGAALVALAEHWYAEPAAWLGSLLGLADLAVNWRSPRS